MQRIIMSTLPDRMVSSASPRKAACDSPESALMQILSRNNSNVRIRTASSIKDAEFFYPPTDAEIAAYDHESIAAIRNQDLTKLKQFKEAGRPLKCSNKFGESLLHMACRKGMLTVTSFMVTEGLVPWEVCDDYGRSPLHDACWAHTTNFDLVDLILKDCPDLLYIEDKRGNTPLSYLTQSKWAAWTEYLQRKPVEMLLPRRSELFVSK